MHLRRSRGRTLARIRLGADVGAMTLSVQLEPGQPARTKSITQIAWALLGLAGPTGLQLLFMVVAARLLGATVAGNFLLVVSAATIASSFSGLGSGGLVMRDTARRASDAPQAIGRAVTMCFVTFLPLLVLVTVASLAITRGAVSIPIILCIAAAELIPMRLMTTFWSLFLAREEQIRGSMLICTMPLCRLGAAGITYYLASENPLSPFAITYLASSVVVTVGSFLYVRRVVGGIPLTIRRFEYRASLSFATTWMNQALQVEADKIIVSFFSPPAVVAVYAVASRLMDGAFMPARALKNVFQARIFRSGAGGHSEAYKLTRRVLPLTMLYGAGVWAAFALVADAVVWVFGPEFYLLSGILPILGALPLLRTISDFGAEVFLASDRPSVQALTQTASTVLRVVLGVILISRFGLEGAVATALSVSALTGAVLWFLVARFLREQKG